MWDILRANCTPEPQHPNSSRLLHPSLVPATTRENSVQASSTLEIIVAMSPEVTVNTADGGQAAHMPPRIRSSSTTPGPATIPRGGTYANTPGGIVPGAGDRGKLVVPNDDLMLNTPWLWSVSAADPDQMPGAEGQDLENNMDGFFTWWDLGNL